MGRTDTPKSAEGMPPDLLPVIYRSGVLTEKQFAEVRARVLSGAYPHDPLALAQRLVHDGILTEYQAGRFLKNKSHGLVVGRYVILDRLGSGGMGRVYKAHHLLMGRVVALKLIAPEIATNARAVSRFQREMKLVGRLDHPNVVRAFDADRADSVLYIAMEYVPGQSLDQRLRHGLLSPAEVADFTAQAARGLAHAHAQGILHRDIKPSNLILTADRQIKVLDLGLGALVEADVETTFATADGVAVGTIDYMSPEQARGKDMDGRSDLYSLGCTMYHLLTGRIPFPGKMPVDRLASRISNRPVPIADIRPDVPPALIQALDKLLATRPEDRYLSGAETADAFKALARKLTSRSGRSHSSTKEATPTAPPSSSTAATPSDFPAWFRPLATLAKDSPIGALLAVSGSLVAAFGAGFALAWVLR